MIPPPPLTPESIRPGRVRRRGPRAVGQGPWPASSPASRGSIHDAIRLEQLLCSLLARQAVVLCERPLSASTSRRAVTIRGLHAARAQLLRESSVPGPSTRLSVSPARDPVVRPAGSPNRRYRWWKLFAQPHALQGPPRGRNVSYFWSARLLYASALLTTAKCSVSI